MLRFEKNGTDIERDLYEWSKLITELSDKEVEYYNLKEALNQKTKIDLTYLEEYNRLLLVTDFKIVLNTNRPTESQKKAYIENQLKELGNTLEELKYKINVLKLDLEICNDRISCYKYNIRGLELLKK